MPFFLIPTTLGVCFCLIWVLIGGMMIRDGQLAAREEREFDAAMLPLSSPRMSRPPSARRVRAKRMLGKRMRVAS